MRQSLTQRWLRVRHFVFGKDIWVFDFFCLVCIKKCLFIDCRRGRPDRFDREDWVSTASDLREGIMTLLPASLAQNLLHRAFHQERWLGRSNARKAQQLRLGLCRGYLCSMSRQTFALFTTRFNFAVSRWQSLGCLVEQRWWVLWIFSTKGCEVIDLSVSFWLAAWALFGGELIVIQFDLWPLFQEIRLPCGIVSHFERWLQLWKLLSGLFIIHIILFGNYLVLNPLEVLRQNIQSTLLRDKLHGLDALKLLHVVDKDIFISELLGI